MAAITKYHKNYNDLDGLFESLFPTCKVPPVDIKETDGEFNLSAEIPGFDESEISVYVDNHVLRIEGRKDEKDEKEGKNKKYLLKERRTASFERSFTLPDNLDEEKISASFKNGVLDVVLPKLPKEEPKRIEVKLN